MLANNDFQANAQFQHYLFRGAQPWEGHTMVTYTESALCNSRENIETHDVSSMFMILCWIVFIAILKSCEVWAKGWTCLCEWSQLRREEKKKSPATLQSSFAIFWDFPGWGMWRDCRGQLLIANSAQPRPRKRDSGRDFSRIGGPVGSPAGNCLNEVNWYGKTSSTEGSAIL